ncbi:MAG: Ldh family oxidoreductase [Clostridiales bacterium]|nr:Ldh family oxidoreductase [Clostridiales bacterium]
MTGFNFEEEKNKVIEALTQNGLDNKQAQIAADCFATADLYGVTSHGCAVLPAHIQRLKRGGYNLNPSFKTIRETPSFAVIDGDNAMGPVSAAYCMNYATDRAKTNGVFSVFSPNNNTFGPAFYYSLKAAEKGCIAFICSNSPAQMAPVGGKEKMLGTNPFSMVIPVPGDDPIMVDMATSVAAKSKFKEYKAKNQPLPDGWALDENGNPTNDPDKGIQGLVQPMAGFKGYSISMLIDIMSGVLSGAAYLNRVGRFYSEDNMNVGFYISAFSPEIILGEEYKERIKDFAALLRNCEPANRQSVCLPGDDRIIARAEKLNNSDKRRTP